jgi:hypothetical protein
VQVMISHCTVGVSANAAIGKGQSSFFLFHGKC